MKTPRWLLPVGLGLGGAALLYGLGRWDGAVDARASEAVRDAKAVLHAGQGYRARQAALRADSARLAERAASLEALASSQKEDIRRLRHLEASQTRPIDTLPTDTVAASIGLHAVSGATWATDSAGVRSLARHVWRSTVLLPSVMAFRRTVDSLLTVTRERLEVSEAGRAIAETRVVNLEAALGTLVKTRECRIAGLLPCLSRTTTFVVGAVLGAAGVYLATR